MLTIPVGSIRRARAFLVATAALAACLAVPAAARCDVVGAEGAFTLHGSHGYSITVLAYSRRADGRGEALVFVYRKRASVTYAAPATVTDARIEADLSSVGEISVAFVPSGSIAEERSACVKDDFVQFDAGTYQGTIEFHGEEGYTEASAIQVPTEFKPFLDLICFGHGTTETTVFGGDMPGARLRVRSVAPGRHLSVQFNENRPGARMTFEAQTSERHEGIAISRSIQGVTPGGAFAFGDDLRAARLDPPAPFSGAAAFHRNAARRNRWAGSLAIDFPGRSNVPLTGPGFRTTLVPVRRTAS
jgi:hypothetical protein